MEQEAQETFLKAKEELEADHLKPGWSLGLLAAAQNPPTPNSYTGGGTPPPTPDSQAPPSPGLPGPSTLPAPATLPGLAQPATPPPTPPSSPGLPGTPPPTALSPPPSPGVPGPSQLPAASPATPPGVVHLEDSEEEAAQLPSLKGSLGSPLRALMVLLMIP